MPTKKRRRRGGARAPRAHLVLRLRKGWSYDAGARCFRKPGNEPVRPGADLPKYTFIRHQLPALARKRNLSPEEDDLARGFQILPPAGSHLQAVLRRVEAWPCVERAWVAPKPSEP